MKLAPLTRLLAQHCSAQAFRLTLSLTVALTVAPAQALDVYPEAIAPISDNEIYAIGHWDSSDVREDGIARWHEDEGWSEITPPADTGWASTILSYQNNIYLAWVSPLPIDEREGTSHTEKTDIYRLSGSGWSKLGSDFFFGSVSSMVGYQGDLVVAGFGFHPAQGGGTNHVLIWDNGSWGPLGRLLIGHEIFGTPNDLVANDDDIFAVGRKFSFADWPIMKFWGNGTEALWRQDRSNLKENSISTAALTETEFYIAGGFELVVDGVDAPVVAQVAVRDYHVAPLVGNGSEADNAPFSPIGPVEGYVNLLEGHTSGIYAAGSFTAVDSVPANNIAVYSQGWEALGDGLDGGTIEDLKVVSASNGDPVVYVAGGFTSAGGIPVNGGARWIDGAWEALDDPLPDWAEGAVSLGEGWYWLDWLGSFNISSAPWFRHNHHGWMYIFPASTPDFFYFWDVDMQSVLFSGRETYPSVFRFTDDRWLYYEKGSNNPRWFVDLVSGIWESW